MSREDGPQHHQADGDGGELPVSDAKVNRVFSGDQLLFGFEAL